MTYFQRVFIKNLRHFRHDKGLSQQKLAEMVGVSPNYLNAVERGVNFPSPEVIQNILDKLALTPAQLFTDPPADITGPNAEARSCAVRELDAFRCALDTEIAARIARLSAPAPAP